MNEIKLSSDRTFGFVFIFVFAFIAIVKKQPYAWFIVILLLLISLIQPKLLNPLNKMWYKLGKLLHRLIHPLAMIILFYGIVTPAALLLKIFQKDILNLKKNNQVNTYWIDRDLNKKSTLKNLF